MRYTLIQGVNSPKISQRKIYNLFIIMIQLCASLSRASRMLLVLGSVWGIMALPGFPEDDVVLPETEPQEQSDALEEEPASDIKQDEEPAIPEASIAEKLSALLQLAEENPLAELLEAEKAIPPKEIVKEEVIKEMPVEEDVKDKAKQKAAASIAKEMQELRYEVAKNNLYIKLSQACRRCDTCSCHKHYESEYHRTFHGGIGMRASRGKWIKKSRSCTHSISGEIEYLDSRGTDRLSVSYELPHSPQRLADINRAINTYKRMNSKIMEEYGRLRTRLEQLGFRYADFGLDDKANTVQVTPPGSR